jgi:hypothetical protein
MNSFIVQSVSQSAAGIYLVVLTEKQRIRGKRSRRDRWRSSGEWSPGDDGPVSFGRQFFDSPNVCLPVDAKSFSELGLFVGAEVEVSLKVISDLVR